MTERELNIFNDLTQKYGNQDDILFVEDMYIKLERKYNKALELIEDISKDKLIELLVSREEAEY